jgi:hypothetical protein
MADLPISYFPIVECQRGSEALQKLCAQLESTLGFVPNVIRAFAWRDARFWEWWAHRTDLMATGERYLLNDGSGYHPWAEDND